MKKIKISFSCDWGETPSQLFSRFSMQTPHNYGIWNSIVGTHNADDCDIIIHLGSKIEFDFQKPFIQLRREPDFIEKFKKDERAIYISDYNQEGYLASSWQFISKSFDELNNTSYFKKNKNISGITSLKWKHRNIFFNKIENMFPNIDFFGKRYGNLHPKFKDDALFNYTYSIAIENSQQKNYFSEKITDCYLMWTKPIYWGCPNIDIFFPENSYINIDISDPKYLKEVINRPTENKDIEDLREARRLVMFKYNIWPTIDNIINNKV